MTTLTTTRPQPRATQTTKQDQTQKPRDTSEARAAVARMVRGTSPKDLASRGGE